MKGYLYNQTKKEYVEVEGSPVPNENGFPLMVHRDVLEGGRFWRVSELTTGAKFAPAGRTRKEAIDHANDSIERILSRGGFARLVRETGNYYGRTPCASDYWTNDTYAFGTEPMRVFLPKGTK